MVNERRAIEIAKVEFAKHITRVDDYSVRVDADDPDDWIVWFEPKARDPLPGDRHSVHVNRKTGKATFLRGE